MSDTVGTSQIPAASPLPIATSSLEGLARRSEAVAIPLAALLVGMVLFSVFIMLVGKSPIDFFDIMWRGAFGSWFSVQNSLSRAAPLLLTALCVALPARLGLVVIGGEGAIVLGGVAAAALGWWLDGAPAFIVIALMAITMKAGAPSSHQPSAAAATPPSTMAPSPPMTTRPSRAGKATQSAVSNSGAAREREF